jgi:hypothetical protein
MQNHDQQKLYTNLYFSNNERIYSGQSLLMIPQYEHLWGDEKGINTTNTICTNTFLDQHFVHWAAVI